MKASKWTTQGRIERGMSNRATMDDDRIQKLKAKRKRQYKRLMEKYSLLKNNEAYRIIERRLRAL